uniref:Putative secreted protein n=1 Tax=Ixodes ricinus TaxID=34613 RepID=V5HAY6_IXORI
MKFRILSSIVIFVAIASTNCQFSRLTRLLAKKGKFYNKAWLPTESQNRHACLKVPDCLYYCKNNAGDWIYGFYNPGTNCSYGPKKLPGSCFFGSCYLILETATDVTSPESTQRSTEENGTTTTPPVETETTLSTPVRNGTARHITRGKWIRTCTASGK